MERKGRFFKFFSSDVQIRIVIENEIYCYVNGFLKWNVSNETSYIVGNKKCFGKICILNLRKKRYLSKSNHWELKVKEDHKGNGQDYN